MGVGLMDGINTMITNSTSFQSILTTFKKLSQLPFRNSKSNWKIFQAEMFNLSR